MIIHRNLAITLGFAGAYIGGAFSLKAAEHAGVIPHGVAAQALQVFNGLILVVYANFLPKRLGNFRNPASAMRMEQVLRVSGWAFMLGGIGFAIASLLPVPVEVPIAWLGSATAYVLGYAGWAFMARGPSKGEPT